MSKRILVIEDDEDMREMLVDILEEEDYEVLAASSGVDAVNQASGIPLDLVVTDVRMAGMDGIDAVGALRKRQPALRSIVITGYASDEAPSRAMREQTWDYLYKPFGRVELVRAVERVLHADEERGRFQRVVDKVAGGYRHLLEAASAAVLRGHLAALDKTRDLVYRAFYVGVRSRKLGAGAAWSAWIQLEDLERGRERLKRAELSSEERGALEGGYQYLNDLMGSPSPDAVLTRPPARAGQVSWGVFQEFYRRVADARLGPEQLTLAPFLRSLDPSALRQSPDLSELYAGVWGELAGG